MRRTKGRGGSHAKWVESEGEGEGWELEVICNWGSWLKEKQRKGWMVGCGLLMWSRTGE